MADNKKSSIKRGSSCYLLNLKEPERTAKRLKLSFQRTGALLIFPKLDRSVEAAVGLLDVSETGAGVFTAELLHKGSLVELTIQEPLPIKVRGLVVWSIPVTSKVQNARFRCRSGIQFVFENDEQKVSVQEFMKRVAVDPLEALRGGAAPAAAPAPAAEIPAAEGVAAPVEAVPNATEATAPVADAAAAPADTAPVAEAAPAEAVATPPAGEPEGTPQAA